MNGIVGTLSFLGKKGLSVKMSMIYHTILDKSGARRWAESFRDANSSSYWLLFKSCCCRRRCNETNELLNFFFHFPGDTIWWMTIEEKKSPNVLMKLKNQCFGVKTPTSIGKLFLTHHVAVIVTGCPDKFGRVKGFLFVLIVRSRSPNST